MAIKNELQWQAEDDARTMARYQEIISDKARLKRATTAAKIIQIFILYKKITYFNT